MSTRFEIGDRVILVGNAAANSDCKTGVVTSIEDMGSVEYYGVELDNKRLDHFLPSELRLAEKL